LVGAIVGMPNVGLFVGGGVGSGARRLVGKGVGNGVGKAVGFGVGLSVGTGEGGSVEMTKPGMAMDDVGMPGVTGGLVGAGVGWGVGGAVSDELTQ